MMKKITYATIVITIKSTQAQRTRRIRYWSIGGLGLVSLLEIGTGNFTAVEPNCETGRPKAPRLDLQLSVC